MIMIINGEDNHDRGFGHQHKQYCCRKEVSLSGLI